MAEKWGQKNADPLRATLRVLTREEFGELSFEVLGQVFTIHNELGRFFEERAYKRALEQVRSDVWLEVPVDATHRDFTKRFSLDVVVAGGGVFEFKAVDALHPQHKAQLLQYLMLTDLRHGMLVNVKSNQVEKEYVNNAISCAERRRFEVRNDLWDPKVEGADAFREHLLAIVQDWGTGLALPVYNDALIHFLGGILAVMRAVEVVWDSKPISTQYFSHAAPGIAMKLTAFENHDARQQFADHARRLLRHTKLDAILWANIARHEIIFSTLRC